MKPRLTIGQAAEAAGMSAKMIRHSERLGLLPPVPRTDSGYRHYGPAELQALRFIRQARQLGFSTRQIAELVGLWRDSARTSREVKALARRHVDELARRIADMAAMKAELERLVAHCHGDDSPHCAILEELANDRTAAAGARRPARGADHATPDPASPTTQER